MMAAHDEEAALRRVELLARARTICAAWAYWCFYGQWGDPSGRKPFQDGVCGGPERRYRAPPMWHPPEPTREEADENLGIAVQRAYVRLPQIYRNLLRAEFCAKPWTIALTPRELDVIIARKAKVSVGAYDITLDRSLLALVNVMRRLGTWRE